MVFTLKLLLLFFCANASASSKLKLPRVLLPLQRFSATNFTLEVSGSGCYKWTLSRLDVIQIIPHNFDKELDCSSQITLSTITKEFTKNTVIVLAEEVSTKEVFRCDVIVDVINSLSIVTKTRQLFVEESPEIFEVRAYDDEGNEFSTLEGVQFSWAIKSGRRSDISSGKNDVIRFINFKDSAYEIPKTIINLDAQGLMGHLILLEGVKTGTANISVELSPYEYRHIPPAIVQLNVIANLIIEPSDTYILPGDVVYYKLLQVKNGRFIEVPLPSAQYSLVIEEGTIAKQLRPWVVEASTVGQTKLILSDINNKMFNTDTATYLPSVTLNVVSPAFMNLVLLPYKNWITTIHQPNTVVAELYDSDNHKIYLGPHAIVNIQLDSNFKVIEKTRNGSYVDGYAITTGSIHVVAELSRVRSNNNVLISLNRVTAEADILVYPELGIAPALTALPWDPVEYLKMEYQLIASGGDGLYQWSITDINTAVVTQNGVVKPRHIGHTEVIVAVQKNPSLQQSAKIIVAAPVDLKIVYNSVEAELGSPIYLSIALYYKTNIHGNRKTALFTDCSKFPFNVNINHQDFFRNGSICATVPENACATIAVIGNNAGSATVTVSYISDGIVLEDKATISTYQPLHIVSPESGRTVLAIGSQRYLVVSGGPSPVSNEGHNLVVNFDKSVVSLEQSYDGNVDDERVFLVTCLIIGETRVTLKVTNKLPLKGTSAVQSVHEILIICARPKSIRLFREPVDSALNCPVSFQQKPMALNDRPIIVKAFIVDDSGNHFDNATSLEVKWTVSNEDLAQILFQDVFMLKDDDRIRYRLPLYHYQTLIPDSKTGNLDLTAKITNYRKHWLKKLRIDADERALKIVPDLQDMITLTLVNSVHISSEFVSVFNHPKNIAKLYITFGSGFYKISSSESEAARIRYLESSKSVDIFPVLPGTFTLTVTDECLNSDPLHVNVFILTVSAIEVDLMDKIEKGKTVKAVLKLYDSEGNPITEKNLLNLNSETDLNIVSVDCDNTGKTNDERIVCIITGLELGITNLVFKAGTENSIVRSAPIRVQVYPPLQMIPRNVTLLVGAEVQLTVKGGPQLDSVMEYSTNSDVIVVDGVGNVVGNEIGECVVVGRAIGTRADGQKIVYSEDVVHVNVVYLEGIRINVPLVKIKSGAKMPIWVEGIPEQIGPLVLGSLQLDILYKWDVSSPNLAQVYHILDGTGVKVPDSDKVSMRLRTLKSGRVVVSVTVIAPSNIVRFAHKGVLTDSINVEIFDELKVIHDPSEPLLLAPAMKFRMKTNKDMVARVSYRGLNGDHVSDILFDVDKKGLVVTHNKYGIGQLELISVEDNDFIQIRRVAIKISRVQYMMLNIVPDLHINADSSIVGLPKGAKLQFYVSYYDNEGSEFTGINGNVKFLVNKVDKTRILPSENHRNFIFDLLEVGTAAIKIFDHDASIVPDFMRLNIVSYVQPDQMKFIVGDAICFSAPVINVDNHQCLWNSSDDNALNINKKSGFGVAKSKQSNIVVSYQCSNYFQIVTTADVYSLQKIEIVASGISNISNNGKSIIIPLVLRNDMEDMSMWRDVEQSPEKDCMKDANEFYFPYDCSVKFSHEGSAHEADSIFRVYRKYDLKYGHSCVIESKENALPVTSQAELNVVLRVEWNRFHGTSISIPFKPAVNVLNKKLSISDQDPVSTLKVSGSPVVLNQIEVIPCNSKFVAIVEELSDVKNIRKFSAYLKPAYLKEFLSASQTLSVFVVSSVTDQNITVPIDINVNADRYVTPTHFFDQIIYYFGEYALMIIVTLIISMIIYFAVTRLFNRIHSRLLGENSSMNSSFERNHFSSSPLSHYSYKRPSFNEIQMIYGKGPEHTHRPRQN